MGIVVNCLKIGDRNSFNIKSVKISTQLETYRSEYREFGYFIGTKQ